MQAIPNQLKSNLKSTKFLFNSPVREVKDKHIILEDGHTLQSHITIIATDASPLISNLKNQETQWKSCETNISDLKSYFFQGLYKDKNTLINNIFYHTSLVTSIPKNYYL